MRHLLGESAKMVKIKASGRILNSTCAEEEKTFEYRVVYSVEETGAHAERSSESDRRYDVSYLAYRMEGKETFEVVLVKCHCDADEHSDASEQRYEYLNGRLIEVAVQNINYTDYAVYTAFCKYA